MKRNWWLNPDLDTNRRPSDIAHEALRDFLSARDIELAPEGTDLLQELLEGVIEDYAEWVDSLDAEKDDLEKKVNALQEEVDAHEEVTGELETLKDTLEAANKQLDKYKGESLMWRKPPPPPLAWTKVASEG
jgi:chromosome segregation ATPase